MPYVATRLGRWFYAEDGAKAKGGTQRSSFSRASCDGGMWAGQRAPLAALGRVVVIDGPGHGKSDVPPPFTLEEHTKALVDAFDALGIAKALVVGLSWGGMLAMRLALYRPERLAAMVLLDTNADATVLRERIEYRAMCAVALRVGLPPLLVRRKVVPLMFGAEAREKQPRLVDDFVRTFQGFSREGLVRATTAVSIERPSIVEALRDIRVPTLVGYGEDDTAAPAHHSRRIASHIPGAELVVFPKLGHLSALEGPDVVNAAIVPFVKAHVVCERTAGG